MLLNGMLCIAECSLVHSGNILMFDQFSSTFFFLMNMCVVFVKYANCKTLYNH